MASRSLVWFISDIVKTVKNPKRVINIFYRKKLLPWLWSYRSEAYTSLKQSAKAGFEVRNYADYSEYVRHQGSKLDRFLLDFNDSWLKKYDISYRNSLRERLRPHIQDSGLGVLCLGARIGTEVKAFIDLGCFTVGLDLNPGSQNRYVVFGDFHELQYADETVDMVFTNSFDHVLYPDKVLSEVRRILKPNGSFLAELAFGREGGIEPGEYESFYWSRLDDLIHTIEEHSFELVHRETISQARDFLIFRKTSG